MQIEEQIHYLSAFPAKSIEVTEGGHSQRLLGTGTEAEHWLTKEDLQRGRDTQRTVGGAVGEQYEGQNQCC